ncbi:MAG: hypothetical protein Q8R04_03230 [Nanoarchaeota archaeon]|nr:hypothetical protein [Nanoarchaeota archaeon]
MADNQAEKTQTPEGKKEEKPKQPTTLESAVNESWSAIKGSTNSVIGAGAIAGATALFGLDGLVTAASFPIGGRIVKKASGKEFTSGNFRDDAIAGALFTPALWYGIEAVKQVPRVFGLDYIVTMNLLGASVSISSTVAGLVFGVLTPALTALYYPLQYVIQNKTFKGLGKDFKQNYLKGLIRTSPLTALTSVAIGATYATPFLAPYLFPALAVANIFYRFFLSPEKLSYKRLLYPSTYLPNFLNPFYLASGTGSLIERISTSLNGAYDFLYKFGRGIHDKIAPKKVTAPAAAPAAQPA